MPETVYLNGTMIPYDKAMVSVEDRGFTFADGVYEVIRCYEGRPFRMEEHLQRLSRSAAEIRLTLPLSHAELASAVEATLAANGLEKLDSVVYIQVTRGPAPRAHAFPPHPRPTTLVIARPEKGPDPRQREAGARGITVADRRWHMCHIKSTGLLLNSLAKQQALEFGCYEAIFVRGEVVTEGTSSNVFIVRDGCLHTHPEGPHILSGVTRAAVLEIAQSLGIPVEIRRFRREEMYQADEAFITGTVTEVMPLVVIDDRPIGDARPGPVTKRIYSSFRSLIASDASMARRHRSYSP